MTKRTKVDIINELAYRRLNRKKGSYYTLWGEFKWLMSQRLHREKRLGELAVCAAMNDVLLDHKRGWYSIDSNGTAWMQEVYLSGWQAGLRHGRREKTCSA